MDFRDFGTLVWAIFIVIAVISSILRSARRAMTNAQGPSQQKPTSAVPSVAGAMPQTPRVIPSVAGATPQTPRVVPSVAGAMPQTPRVIPSVAGAMPQTPRVIPSVASEVEGRPFRRGGLVRGIIALEVLGPPRALREWKPIV